MRSDLIFGALTQVPGRFQLTRLAANATRKFHRPDARIQDTTNDVRCAQPAPPNPNRARQLANRHNSIAPRKLKERCSMLQPTHIYDGKAGTYAPGTDSWNALADEMHNLYLLSLLLTADPIKPNSVFSAV